MGKTLRPRIPEQTQRELWARAAGRCEFRGCNKLLYKDSLTQQPSNLARISHIVGFSPDGPRGDTIRSRLLQTDISNLMLTCAEHAKIIDDKERVPEYPVDLLREFKREHELRVRMLTDITGDAKTHVLLMQVSIDAHEFEIDTATAFKAMLPSYPAEEDPLVIDLTGMAIPTHSEGFFTAAQQTIATKVNEVLRRRPGGKTIRRLAVFALAPIPLLVALGHALGDIAHVDLYQRHRDSQDWAWTADEEAGEFFEVHRCDDQDDEGREIAVLLSVSDSVRRSEVKDALGHEPVLYEIRAAAPGLDFLRSGKRLELFGYEARKLLHELRNKYDHSRTIHLFAAVPAPVAIEFGRSVRGLDPTFRVYEYSKQSRSYFPALSVNACPEASRE
jgi:hypothetical protein